MNREEFSVLVVDDEELIANNLAMVISFDGFKTLKAYDGTSALEICKNNKVDFVITDVRMPNGDGISLLEKLKSLDTALPVVLLVTGQAEISREDAIQKGALDLLNKPMDIKKITEFLELHFEKMSC